MMSGDIQRLINSFYTLMTSDIEITDIPFFKGLTKARLTEISKILDVKEYKKGTVILNDFSRDNVFVVKSGRCEVYLLVKNKIKFIIDVYYPGVLFGVDTRPAGKNIIIKTLDNCKLYSINRQKFSQLMKDDIILCEQVIMTLARRMIFYEERMTSLAIDDVQTRFLKLLIYLGEKNKPIGNGQLITDKFTHEQMSRMIGTSRQTVTTLLLMFKKKDLIERNNKRIIFRKKDLEKVISY